VNAEFNWWLLIVGLVLGAALTWLVMAETTRRDADLTESEQRGEALWIASVLSSSGRPTEGEHVEEILRLHREYLAAPMPDEPHEAPTPEQAADGEGASVGQADVPWEPSERTAPEPPKEP
jgi:hypothetical protein